MVGSGVSPGALSFRLAGDVEKSFDTFSANGDALDDCRGDENGDDVKPILGRCWLAKYELYLTAEGFLAACRWALRRAALQGRFWP